MSFADWLWSVISLALGLKTIPDLLDTNSTHMGIAYAHLTAPQSCDYIGYVRHVGHAAISCQITSYHSTRIGIIAHILTGLSSLKRIKYHRQAVNPWA